MTAHDIRQRFARACLDLGLDPQRVGRQYRRNGYEARWEEIRGWPDPKVETHCRMLESEAIQYERMDTRPRVRQRILAAGLDEGLSPVQVTHQFDVWAYPEKDLEEMDLWEKKKINAHARLLAEEAAEGVGQGSIPWLAQVLGPGWE